MSSSPPTSAVVVVYNNEPSIVEHCFKSVRDNGVTKVVLVDNASSFNYQPLAQRFSAHYLRHKKNEGFAAAVNHGAQELTSQYLLLLNPDACLPPQAVARAEALLATDPKVGMVGFLLCDPAGQVETSSFGPAVTLWSLLSRKLYQPSVPRTPMPVGWVSAGACMIRSSVWQKCGGFDPAFFLYWEDVDLCRRIYHHGFTVLLMPTIRVRHERGLSLKDTLQKTALYDASADRYFRKHYAQGIWKMHLYLRSLYRRLWRRLVY